MNCRIHLFLNEQFPIDNLGICLKGHFSHPSSVSLWMARSVCWPIRPPFWSRHNGWMDCNEIGTDIHVHLRMNRNNSGDALIFLAALAVNFFSFIVMTKTCKIND